MHFKSVFVKTKRSVAFHREKEIEVKQGAWTLQETCLLDSVESFLMSTNILPNAQNIA